MALGDKRKAQDLQYGVFPLPVMDFPHSAQARRLVPRGVTVAPCSIWWQRVQSVKPLSTSNASSGKLSQVLI